MDELLQKLAAFGRKSKGKPPGIVSSITTPHKKKISGATCKKKFENWIKGYHSELSLDPDGAGYFDARTQLAWEAWQTAYGEAHVSTLRTKFFWRKRK